MTILEKMRERYGKAAYEASLPTGGDVIQVVGLGTVSMWSRLTEDAREQWRNIGEAAVKASHIHDAFSSHTKHGNGSDGLWREPIGKLGDAGGAPRAAAGRRVPYRPGIAPHRPVLVPDDGRAFTASRAQDRDAGDFGGEGLMAKEQMTVVSNPDEGTLKVALSFEGKAVALTMGAFQADLLCTLLGRGMKNLTEGLHVAEHLMTGGISFEVIME